MTDEALVRRWHYRQLLDIIDRLQLLPDDDPRIVQALNLLDLAEIDWRTQVHGEAGRHVWLNPEASDGPHTVPLVDNVDRVDID